ncbi:cytochrome P450 [Purpureocillium lavendulum]|uniref:Cytochrome P450 n=1 Tax=Purpureocillium lavendulum TaxID=1247861 RepID=A0AB34FXF1_9HYPO|nr:cytochrome P450 [Purpureocillium lavendulum]
MDKLSLWTTGWRLGLLTIFILVLSYLYFQKRRQDKADELFGRQHGCQPIRRKLPYTWPFAIDVFKSQYDALMRGALLAYQADFFRNFDVGQTFEVRLLGQVGYFTMDPKNLEHMLQTQFASLEQNEHAAFAEAFDYTSLISAMRMRLADWYWVYNPSKYRKACALINTYATHYVNHALKELEENGEDVATKRHPFILDLFRALQHPKLVHDQLMNVLIAGRDTTACLMSWAW